MQLPSRRYVTVTRGELGDLADEVGGLRTPTAKGLQDERDERRLEGACHWDELSRLL